MPMGTMNEIIASESESIQSAVATTLPLNCPVIISAILMLTKVTEMTTFAGEVRRAGFTHALLCGMGGSSLAPDVMARMSLGDDRVHLAGGV